MLIKKDFHAVHYEAVKAEKAGIVFPSQFSGKGSTQKIYIFKNGYGASVIQGFMSYGLPELAVLFFENPVRLYRSKKKRLKKKAYKNAGNYILSYDTPVTSDIKRYTDQNDLTHDLNLIANLKGWS